MWYHELFKIYDGEKNSFSIYFCILDILDRVTQGKQILDEGPDKEQTLLTKKIIGQRYPLPGRRSLGAPPGARLGGGTR